MVFDYGNANEQQKEAIRTTEGPLLIIAGPGTGKTYTLVKRIAYLIVNKNVKPEEIFVATFTEKAAKELVTRITNELLQMNISVNLNEMYVGTFHSLCLRILKDHLEYTRIKKNYRLLDRFDQKYLIYQHMNDFRAIEGFDELLLEGSVWKQAGKLAAYFCNIEEELADISAMKKDENPTVSALAKCVEKYNEIAAEENVLDFSGIQTECYALLKNNPDILKSVREQIKYILVDEYQDTNYIQELLVFLLAKEHQNICVVGDDDQGLYRFRGATIRNILQFPQKFPDGRCKQIFLKTNYRSETEIIDFYNNWMQETNTAAYPFRWDEFRFEKTIEAGKRNRNEGTSVVRCSADRNYNAWYERIYALICELKNSGKLTNYNQIAFLCKSVKNDKVVNLIHFLEAHGIDVYSPRSNIYFQRAEVQTIVGCLIKCFPGYERQLRTRSFEYDNEKLYDYLNMCLSYADLAIEENEATLGRFIDEKRALHQNLKQNTDYAFTGLFYQLMGYQPFKQYIDITIGSGVIDERAARNLSIFSSILGKYEYLRKVEVFTPDRIESIVLNFFNLYFAVLYSDGLDEYEDDSEYAPSNCVSFMTIHQAKGMEFPVVLVGSLNLYPKDNIDYLLNYISIHYFHRAPFERTDCIKFYDFWRLYYTAFSRAQNLLVLTCNEMGGSYTAPNRALERLYYEAKDWEEADLSNVSLDTVKPVNLKDTYSFTSHIAVYENCALQYKFFKELGFSQVRVGATLFGTLVHETIEDVHRAAMRHEENTITPDNVRMWLDTNYFSLAKKEHSYLGSQVVDAAYQQVMRYIRRMTDNGQGLAWSHIQDAEVEVSLVKPEYILKGQIDLIRGDDDSVEIIDFKSEKKPDFSKQTASLERYRRQLEVYAYLVEQQCGKQVSKMHLYYTGEENGSPFVTFEKSDASIDVTISEFDGVVEKIQRHDFSGKAKDKKLCQNCDMRYFCGAVKKGKR